MCIELSHHFIRKLRSSTLNSVTVFKARLIFRTSKDLFFKGGMFKDFYHNSLYNDSEIYTLFKSLIKLAGAKNTYCRCDQQLGHNTTLWIPEK